MKGVIPDLERLLWKGRKVTIAFDSNVRENGSVQAVRWEFTRELRARGAVAHWLIWPGDTPDEVNGVDDLLALWGPDRVLNLLEKSRPAKLTSEDQRSSAREFVAVGDDRYRLTLPGIGVSLEIDRLRRERHELVGELCVRCDLPGARTVNGSLSIADLNLSSARARSERAKLLADRSNT